MVFWHRPRSSVHHTDFQWDWSQGSVTFSLVFWTSFFTWSDVCCGRWRHSCVHISLKLFCNVWLSLNFLNFVCSYFCDCMQIETRKTSMFRNATFKNSWLLENSKWQTLNFIIFCPHLYVNDTGLNSGAQGLIVQVLWSPSGIRPGSSDVVEMETVFFTLPVTLRSPGSVCLGTAAALANQRPGFLVSQSVPSSRHPRWRDGD